MQTSIRFKHHRLAELRERLLADSSCEHFAVLLACERVVGSLRVLTVLDVRYPRESDYLSQGVARLKVNFDTFMRGVLVEARDRIDCDTVIDVHTHPFAHAKVEFSVVDDADESTFCAYLAERGLSYASIVFSQDAYAARWWEVDASGTPKYTPATVRGQTALEGVLASGECDGSDVDAFQDRSVRALGLAAMRRIAGAARITIVGVGGLGSVAAEHLVHMGFTNLALIDHDVVETTNLNRLVGATLDDAAHARPKVEVVRDHLLRINPALSCVALAVSAFTLEAEESIAASDWVLLCTDNHASRFHVQGLCFRYFVPFVTAGVNITVEGDSITDYSGESILVRMGDRVCLSCLGRVNYDAVAAETHPDAHVRTGLVTRGYVQGTEVREPAVKTLNTHVATIAVDTLVNQYTGRRPDAHILVFEENGLPVIWEDKQSVARRNLHCSVCGI